MTKRLERIVARLNGKEISYFVHSIELADWWSDLGPAGQDSYISEHPNSDKAKNAQKKADKKAGKDAPKKESKKEEKDDKGPTFTDDMKTEEQKKQEQKEKEANDSGEIETKPEGKEQEKQKEQLDKKEEQVVNDKNNDAADNKDSPEKKVKEEDRKDVVAILDKLKQMSDEAQHKGKKAPNFDLCEVSVPGTNLFCGVNKGIPRAKMPQLKGMPAKGTPAEDLPKDDKGEVNAEDAFKISLINKGVKMEPKKVDASKLKSTQSQLVGAKVAGMVDALKKDPNHKAIRAPIFVSKDGYILDGHHRWAAVVGLSLVKDTPLEMNVVEVDMSAEQLVEYTNTFANEIGIEQKGA